MALGIIMEIIINNNAVVETGVIGVLSTRHSFIEWLALLAAHEKRYNTIKQQTAALLKSQATGGCNKLLLIIRSYQLHHIQMMGLHKCHIYYSI